METNTLPKAGIDCGLKPMSHVYCNRCVLYVAKVHGLTRLATVRIVTAVYTHAHGVWVIASNQIAER